MAKSDHMHHETVATLRLRVENLERSLGRLNEKLAQLDPTGGDLAALRRVVLAHDLKLGEIFRDGPVAIVASSQPFSD